jgi:hypothetical protein
MRVGIKHCEQKHGTCCRFSDENCRSGHLPYTGTRGEASRGGERWEYVTDYFLGK